jgi:hypothetical protein
MIEDTVVCVTFKIKQKVAQFVHYYSNNYVLFGDKNTHIASS